MKNRNLQAETLNAVDIKKIPAAIQTDLCFGAIELAILHRADPGYQERFAVWLAEQQHKRIEQRIEH